MKKKKFNEYAKLIALGFGVPKKRLFEPIQEREIVDARQLLYLVCFRDGFPLVSIQRLMVAKGYNVKNHSSISHGIKRMTIQIEKDSDYKKIVEEICDTQ
tara:strand:+ start:1437 stop:1736 length:300 start_codon:yes stop_codon:yes gene_type:complete